MHGAAVSTGGSSRSPSTSVPPSPLTLRNCSRVNAAIRSPHRPRPSSCSPRVTPDGWSASAPHRQEGKWRENTVVQRASRHGPQPRLRSSAGLWQDQDSNLGRREPAILQPANSGPRRSPPIPTRPQSSATTSTNSPADSPSRHPSSPPVPSRPAHPGVGRRESGGKSGCLILRAGGASPNGGCHTHQSQYQPLHGPYRIPCAEDKVYRRSSTVGSRRRSIGSVSFNVLPALA
jgi:hypothetical protein